MKMLGPMAIGALVVGVVLTGWARSAGRGAETTPQTRPAGPVQSAPTSPSSQPSPARPTAPKTPLIQPDLPGPAGLDVRYLDTDGEIKKLDVKDFPR
jgi:multidrug efflux pump subunit AcrA (membrane-fusion protein)